MNIEINEKLRDNCEVALTTLRKLEENNTSELQAHLEWCIGSFDFDKNPVGLHEYGVVTLQALKEIKGTNPRKINKKIIDGLEKSLQGYEASLN